MRKSGGMTILLGLILLLAAAGLSGYNLWQSAAGGKAAEEALDAIEEKIYEPTEEEEVSEPVYKLYPGTEMPVIDINGYGYIGYLDFPTLGLRLPVMSEWSDAGLHVAPGRYMGSAYTNDLIIAGHNYYSHFGRLNNLTIGAPITLTDMDGNVFTYTAVEMESIPGTAIEEMEAGDWDLSLFTCDMSGRNRFTVRCNLASE